MRNASSICLMSALLLGGAAAVVSAADGALRLDPVYEPRLSAMLPGGAENVFRGAKIEVPGHWNDRVPAFAVDGKAEKVGDHWGVEGLPAKLMLDLGSRRSLNTVRLWSYWGDDRHYQYLIDGSTDGKSWIVLGDQRKNTRPAAVSVRAGKTLLVELTRLALPTPTADPAPTTSDGP